MSAVPPAPATPPSAGDDPAVRLRELEVENAQLRAALECGKGDGEPAALARLTEAERLLRQREHDLRSVLDNLPAMVGYWDRDLRNRFANQAYSHWFDITPARMFGMHIREVIGEERYRLNLPYIEAALRGEPQLFERAIPALKGGGMRHSLAHYLPDIVDGEVKGFYAMVTEVTAVKEAEAALRSSEERYRAVVEDQTELICRFTRDGRFIFVNDIYCRFFGVRRENILGKRWQPVAHPEDVPRVEAQLSALSAANPVVVIENRAYSGAGELRWMQFVNRAFFDAAGGLTEIQSVGRDVTDRKAAEQALEEIRTGLEKLVAERTEQLRQLAVQATLAEERERQSIARDLHDDLGQRLHVARLKLDALAKTEVGASPQLAELGEIIGDASRLVRSLTSQLSPPVLRDLGLPPALQWLCDEMERQYGLVVDAEIAILPKALSEARSAILFRAVRELLINVSRHAGTDRAHLQVLSLDSGLLLTVEDQGVGLQESGNPVTDGGFGLASVRERILFFGGRMELQSPPVGGARVVLWMPYGNGEDGGAVQKP